MPWHHRARPILSRQSNSVTSTAASARPDLVRPDLFFALTLWILALGPLALLLGALGFEHWGGLAPCHLCLLQRGPLLVAALVGLFALSISRAHGTRAAFGPLLAFASLVLALGAGIAAYHAGVEWGWWSAPATCTAPAAAVPTSPEALAAARAGARIIRCDVVPWSLFGLSLAAYNVLISSAFAVLAFVAMRRTRDR